MDDTVVEAIAELEADRDMSAEVCEAAIRALLSGAISHEQTTRFLLATSRRLPTVEELVAAATVLRQHMSRIACDAPDAIDTCGTGGDGINTFNVSTAAAIVATASGATVAKHGNRSHARASGSSDVAIALGIDIDAPPPIVERSLRTARIAYLNAARLHPAMAHVAAARREVRVRTLFNLLGPLANPAGVRRQLVGVPRPELTEMIAAALAALGSTHALVVCGHDGLCDLTITGPARVTQLADGRCRTFEVRPEDFGMKVGSIDALLANGPEQSAAMIRAILDGRLGAARDHLLLNAAAALVAGGLESTLDAAARRAAEAIDTGRAAQTLADWVRASRGKA